MERQQAGIQGAHRRQVAGADEAGRVLGVVLEHVAHLDGAGETLSAEFVPAERPVENLFTEGVAQGRRVLLAGEVIASDAHRRADEFRAATEDAECGPADVADGNGRHLLIGHPDVVLIDAGRAAIAASAPANAARVRELFVEVVGPERLAVIKAASDDVLAALTEHIDTCASSRKDAQHAGD